MGPHTPPPVPTWISRFSSSGPGTYLMRIRSKFHAGGSSRFVKWSHMWRETPVSIFVPNIQVGSRPDRCARGMLHISGGGSERGVAESGRGGSNVPPTGGNNRWGNVIDIRSGETKDFHFVCVRNHFQNNLKNNTNFT